MIGGTRLSRAACARWPPRRARSRHGAPSRRRAQRARRAICRRSTSGSSAKTSTVGRSSVAKRFTPTTTEVARVDRLLRAVGRLLDLALDVAAFRSPRSVPPMAVDPVDAARRRPASISFVSRSMCHDPPNGSTVLATPDSCAMICCVRSAMRGRVFGGQRQRLVAAVGVQRLRAAEHRGQRLQRDAHDVVVGLLRGQRAAGRLRVEAQLQRPRVGGAEAVAHDPRPQAAGGAELGDLFEEVVVGVEEERQPLAERVRRRARRRPPPARRRCALAQRERHLLHRRRAGLADVVAADRDRVPLRHLALAVGEDVGDDPQRRPRAGRCRCRGRCIP